MRIAVLGSPDGWYFRDLRRAAADRDELVSVSFERLNARLGCGRSNVVGVGRHDETIDADGGCLRDFDAILVRTMAPGSLEQVVFRMDALARLEALGATIVNPPKAIEAAVDKFLTSARLQAAGLPTPRTIACQTADDALEAFAELGGDVVVKPVFGSEGRGIARLQDEALAQRAFQLLEQLKSLIYLQEFVPHEGADLRLLVVGDDVFGIRRRNADDWRTNCSRGAVAEPLVVTAELAETAQRAAAAVGASVAGVDLLPARDGRLLAIEVNAVPGWKALGRALDRDVAAIVLAHVRRLATNSSKYEARAR